MRVSWEWLNEYVDCSGISPQELAEQLTHAGLEVDDIEHLGAKFKQVVVAKVAKLDPHPNADKLRLVTVDAGEHGTQQVVCGAPNVAEGITIAFALDGATVLNRKDGSSFVLGAATIRGVESRGMVCSLDELGLSEQYEATGDGIWVLDDVLKNPTIGQPLEDALNLPTDVVLHTAPTANRGDWMSMVGVARDVAALLNRPVTLPDVTLLPVQGESDISITLSNKELCSYYSGVTMTGLTMQPSPAWMQARLEAAGVRSHNILVDVTNYVMLEWGQPLHAFDAGRLIEQYGNSGKVSIDVRHGKAGEAFTSLDDEEHTLSETAVTIDANGNAVALAGVMGGKTTEIEDKSQQVFLEAAVFDGAAIRKSAKSLGMRSESSARFERGVDAAQCALACARAVQLYQQLAGANISSVVADGCADAADVTLTLRLARIEAILGAAVAKAEVVDILSRLGFEITNDDSKSQALTLRVPSYRQVDVTREIDVIEEIARITGYDDIPDALPPSAAPVAYSARQQFLKALHSTLQGAGLQEVMTNSLVGPKFLETMNLSWPERTQVTVTNSHSPDHTLLRQTVLPSLLEVAKTNTAPNISAGGDASVWVYELGRIFEKRGKANDKASGVVEKRALAALMMGSPVSAQWQQGNEKQAATDFYTAKGVIETLMAVLGVVGNTAFIAPKTEKEGLRNDLHPGQQAAVQVLGKTVGSVGVLHPAWQKRLKLRQTPVVFELDAEQLFKLLKQQSAKVEVATSDELSSYPMVTRDMAFVAADGVTHADIVAAITALDEALIQDVVLFDEYRGEHVDAGHRSLAYRLVLQCQEKTLTDERVNTVTDRVKHALSHQYSVTFR